jgi:hypothetical protein
MLNFVMMGEAGDYSVSLSSVEFLADQNKSKKHFWKCRE